MPYPQPSPDLLKNIILRIHKEERILVVKSLALFSATLIFSVAAFFPTFKLLYSQLETSGFLQFFSLFFSDFSTVATYWKSFAMIILETIPALSIALLLALLLTFLQSVKSITRDIRIIIKIAI